MHQLHLPSLRATLLAMCVSRRGRFCSLVLLKCYICITCCCCACVCFLRTKHVYLCARERSYARARACVALLDRVEHWE